MSFLFLKLQIVCIAQMDTVYIHDEFLKHVFPPSLVYFESESISPDSALDVFLSRDGRIKDVKDSNLGIVSNLFWFLTTVKNTGSKTHSLLFVVAHPHLRRVAFFEIENHRIIRREETGYQLPFYDRNLQHRFFLMEIELPPGGSKNIMLLIDQENSLNLPVSLWDRDQFYQLDDKNILIYGLGFGFVFFCSLFALAGTIILRNRTFIWYFLYLVAALLYGFVESGFAAQYLYPSLKNFEGPFSIHTALYPFIFLIKFSQALLATKQHMPRTHKVLNYIFAFLISMVVADVILNESWRKYALYFLPVVFGVILVGLMLLAYCGIKALHRAKSVAVLYLTGSGMIIISSTLSIPNTVFGISENWSFNPVLIGFLLEVTFLSFALIAQYRQVESERKNLAQRIALQQKEMYKSYIDGVEKERNRIASELHDDIGSRLSYLKRRLDESTSSFASQLDEIVDSIRQVSHELAPPVAHMGLMPLVEKLVREGRESSGIDIKLQQFGFQEKLNNTSIHHIYRILQEAIHNIVKHSNATQADVQLFGYDDELVITLEDNGKGFIIEGTSGLGLTQMRVRTESIGGKIEITSAKTGGCHIMLTIPFS